MDKPTKGGPDSAGASDVDEEMDGAGEVDGVNPTVFRDKTTRSRSEARRFMSTPSGLRGIGHLTILLT
jgi:hypothetical protein